MPSPATAPRFTLMQQWMNLLAVLKYGIVFSVLLVFLQLVGVLTPRTLLGHWRIAIVAVFVIAAVITPSGDPISLMALSIPMCILYFISIFAGWVVLRGRRKAEATSS